MAEKEITPGRKRRRRAEVEENMSIPHKSSDLVFFSDSTFSILDFLHHFKYRNICPLLALRGIMNLVSEKGEWVA